MEESLSRAVAARGNYLARIAWTCSSRRRSRRGSRRSPRSSAKRLAKCLKDNKRAVIEYKFQRMPKKVVMWSDTDFAGCERTRRSTSGGVVMLGCHCVKTSSQTQEAMALSAGESEFHGIVKAATMG